MAKKYQRHYRYGELTKAIINHIFSSLLAGYEAVERKRGVSLTLILEAVEFLLASIKDKKEKERKVLRVLKNLEKKEILNLIQVKDRVYVTIKDKNNPKVIEYSIRALLDFKKKTKKWLGKWFLVFFDVPEIQRNKRDYLRLFLKRLGFYPYQKSVYIFPYECEEEVILIKKIVEGAAYMNYIVAEKIEREEEVKEYFKL